MASLPWPKGLGPNDSANTQSNASKYPAAGISSKTHSGQSSTPANNGIPIQPKNVVAIPNSATVPELKKRLYDKVCQGAIDSNIRLTRVSSIAREALGKSRAMTEPNFTRVGVEDLSRMIEAYDNHFLGGVCMPLARSYGIQFRWSSRMTRTGGKTVRTVYRNPKPGTSAIQYEIVLSSSLLFQTFRDIDRPIRVSGMMCHNRLEAMQRIVEHELLHLVEMLVWDDSCCAAKRFQSIAWRLFGHTEHKHDLVTQQERAAVQFKVRVGSHVQFCYEGKVLRGVVNRITRRATVLVVDPKGQLFTDGRKYLKYYIPLQHLKPVPAA